jgi:cyclophilin family peptidyl-prolyl cis-trans isomerase
VHVARLLLVALMLAVAGCGGGDDESAATEAATSAASTTAQGACATVEAPEPKPDGGEQPPVGALDEGKTYKLVVETNCGSFTIQLDQETAPKTAASLVSLAESGFFDGTIFHRVVPGFVIQGGDPTGTGTGGPGYKTVDVPPPGAAYTEGVVAMAKAGTEAPGTSGSQFFVVTGADAGLPAEYAVVGKVTDGLETVLAIDKLGAGDGPPSQPVVIDKVTVESS